MSKILYPLLFLVFINGMIISQERMTVKPEGFNYQNLPKTPEVVVPSSNETRVVIMQNQVMTVGPNVRIVTTSGNQTELSASIWTANPNYVFVGANSDPGQGYYYTVNGGSSWAGGDLLPGSVAISSDPACTFSNTGVLHFNYFDNIMVSDRSSNGGVNWMGRTTVPTSGSFDKNHNTVDVLPSSPYYGRIYVVWSYFSLSQPPIVLSYSTDGGATYSSQQQIGAPTSGHYEQGCNIQTGPGGVVYCIWAMPMSGSPYTETGIGFTKSTNGGANWSAPVTALTINGIRGNILSTNIRVNSFPSMAVDKSGGARNGYVYITWGQRNLAPAGSDADICFAYSSNGGTSWSTPVRVNDDAMNNGKNQFFPWMTIDQSNGTLAIVFYDTRDNATADSCNTYIATSTNGGTSWINTRVSDHSQRPAPLSGYASGYYGDYIAIAAHNNVIWPFWMDNRNGPAQVYTAKVTLGPPPAHDVAIGPFMSFPPIFLINTAYAIKTRIQNLGSSSETGVPVKWFINGTLTNTTNINLNTGQIDSVSNTWTPVSAGIYTLKYVSALANDTNRFNDTVQTSVTVYASIPPLCEGFNSSTFPPTGWSVTGSGSTYWSRQTPSGYNLGVGSARFNSWSAPTGAIGNLITSTFNTPTTTPLDSLMFDYAYCPYYTSNEQLIIQTSTDNGSTFTTLLTMNYTDLTTTTACNNSEFTPSLASDWKTKNLSMPIGTNKANIEAVSAFGNDIWVDSICWKRWYGVNNNNNEFPRVFSLLQNYPNPFNPATEIKYALPKASVVKMVVYDLTGREVMTLVNETKQAGNYTVKFDGSNLASGVYFYKLTAGDFSDVRKMVLIK